MKAFVSLLLMAATNKPGTTTATVTAGDKLGFVAVSAVTHFGPVSFYMARVPEGRDINTWDAAGNVWFKVAEISAVPSPGGALTSGEATWPAYNKKSVEFTVPKSVPNGKYLVRVESIALHQAQSSVFMEYFMSQEEHNRRLQHIREEKLHQSNQPHPRSQQEEQREQQQQHQHRIPLLKTSTHHPDPEPTLPIRQTKINTATTNPISIPDSGGGSVYFIGTATTILSYPPFRILTDPNFLHAGDHVHLGPGVTAQRLTDPAVPDMGVLPPVDVVLLSHYHEDHFDREVERLLSRDVPIVTTRHAQECLTAGEKGFRAVRGVGEFEALVVMDEGYEMGGGREKGKGEKRPAVRVTGMPGKHVPPGLLAKANELLGAVPPTNGWLVELGWTLGGGEEEEGVETGYRIYISGDTLLVDELKEIPARLQGDKIDLMLVHLGGTTIPRPKMPLLMVTMDATQGVHLMRLVDPDVTVPIHFDDYDVFCSPLDDFKKEVEAAGFGDRVVYLDRGDEYRFAVRENR
ncbi:glycosyl hydrolase family 61-domain-containing protein [Achaetomium macrosporum]|uniref:Glycosyl hydrolase family 61-domain-containing protein n=1 Tax=Achaetomium macrosporum TaxID=79813 RepID=A0AAN7HB40_9PEZI|nr:glycosyl hydrolase family 61-domain-containing protein [Achaetomium macrosporum]